MYIYVKIIDDGSIRGAGHGTRVRVRCVRACAVCRLISSKNGVDGLREFGLRGLELGHEGLVVACSLEHRVELLHIPHDVFLQMTSSTRRRRHIIVDDKTEDVSGPRAVMVMVVVAR